MGNFSKVRLLAIFSLFSLTLGSLRVLQTLHEKRSSYWMNFNTTFLVKKRYKANAMLLVVIRILFLIVKFTNVNFYQKVNVSQLRKMFLIYYAEKSAALTVFVFYHLNILQ